jgi:hypothetical protein
MPGGLSLRRNLLALLNKKEAARGRAHSLIARRFHFAFFISSSGTANWDGFAPSCYSETGVGAKVFFD